MSAKDLKEAAKDLPKDWQVFESKKSNRIYYYNNITKKTQWHRPGQGEGNKKEENCRAKKRKASTDNKFFVKNEQKTSESFKQENQKNQGQIRIKFKNEQKNCEPFIPRKELLLKLPKGKEPEKQFLKVLPKLPAKLKLAGNVKTNTDTLERAQGMVKNYSQVSESCNKTAKTNTQTWNKNNPQGNKSANKTGKSNFKITKPVFQNSKTVPQESTVNEHKIPPLMKSTSLNEPQANVVPKLQPLVRAKSLGEGSDSGVSDSSDRILAWLADTSRINFRNHPVPNPDVERNERLKTEVKPNQAMKQMPGRKTGKQKSQRKKAVIVERVQTNSETSKPKSDILEKLLPERPQTLGKQRYAPYKLTPPDSKQSKATSLTQIQPTKDLARKTPEKTTASNTLTIPPANQNNLSGKATLGGATNVASVQNINNFSKQNGLQETSQFVSHEGHGEVLPQQDEVLSMEGSDVSIPLSESEVAEMEIDNAEEFAKEIVQELKLMRGSVVVDPNVILRDQMAMKISDNDYKGTLYIVLDTNVLLSHLKFVTELKDFPIPGVGMPTLVIPWVVIQELDSLKENKWKSHATGKKTTRVDMLARVAIKFLNNSFQRSDPRVRGQTVDEASEHVSNLQEETNDDRILQCCLLFRERAQNGSCVLFSNDINLCNKAMVNGIKAFNHEKLLPGLKSLFQSGAIVKQHSEEYNTQLAIEEDQARRRQKADDILCELQIILREGLSYIIEYEMKKAYDDLWLEIVYIKPPWTLIDVLQLLDKHWIAVFGHVLKRDRKQLIDEIRQKFNDRKGSASALQFCSEMLQVALQLFESFACHSSYDDAMPKCLAAVNVLVQKCEQFEASVTAGPGTSQAKCLTYPTTSNVTSLENNNAGVEQSGAEQSGVVGGNNGIPHEEVMNTFNLIWTAVTQFSTQIFTALGYPNTITDAPPQDYPRASKEEALSFLRVLCPKLLNLVRSIQNVLLNPWEKVCQNDNLFIQLEQAIGVFLKEVLSEGNNASAEKLFRFCEDASMRTALVQGLSQLDRASAMLQHCASCVVQSNTALH